MADTTSKNSENAKAVSLVKGYVLGVTTVLALGFVFYRLREAPVASTTPPPPLQRLERRFGQPKVIWPLLDCWHPSLELEEAPLKGKIIPLLKSYENKYDFKLSLYFKRYSDGRWFGYRQNESIRLGSLLKVALFMAYMRDADKHPGRLDAKIKFNSPEILKLYDLQSVQPSHKIVLGETYTIRDLLERVVIYSDDAAASLLEKNDTDHSMMRRLALELDVPIKEGIPPERPITTREYASLFKILYNASYLTEESSIYTLETLMRTEFKEGLVKELPSEVQVAHKFGESFDDQNKYFSDCGILYVHANPYILCMTIKGQNTEHMAETIADISKNIYTEETNSDAGADWL